MVSILLTRGKHVHDRINSLRCEVWAYKISLIPPRYIEVPVLKKKSGSSYVCKCVNGINIPLSNDFFLLKQSLGGGGGGL